MNRKLILMIWKLILMNWKLILCSELTWIVLIFIFSLSALFYYRQKNVGNDYIKQLSNTLFCSLIALAVIFGGYLCFHPKVGGVFNKLISGEVIVGVAVAFPVLFTWYRKDQKQKELYDYQLYAELKNDYLTWFKSFYEENITLNLALVNLEQIIERVKVFDDISDSGDMHPIDFASLFVAIQEKFKESCILVPDQSDINNIYESWRMINNKIIDEIDETQRRNHTVQDVYAIDFVKKSEMLEYYDRAYSFNGCKFESDEFVKFVQGDGYGQYKFNYIFLDRKLTSDELKIISNSGELNCYFYTDDLGNTLSFDCDQEKEKQDSINLKNSSEEFSCSLSNDLTQTSESLSQEEFSCSLSNDPTQTSESPSQERPSNSYLIYENSDLIYENRDLADYGPINDLIESGKSITVNINNDNSSIKQKIFDELKLSIPMLNKIKNDHYFISRSKNFVPDMKNSEQKKWKWHSWNVLTKMKTEDEKIEFYIFAVQISDRAFECIVINRENLGELLKHKSMTKDLRYFFYFAKEK